MNPLHSTELRRMATIEVSDACISLPGIMADISYDSRLQPARTSRHGYKRYGLMVNTRRGASRAASTVRALLSTLLRIAESGEIQGFRIMTGKRWVDESHAC